MYTMHTVHTRNESVSVIRMVKIKWHAPKYVASAMKSPPPPPPTPTPPTHPHPRLHPPYPHTPTRQRAYLFSQGKSFFVSCASEVCFSVCKHRHGVAPVFADAVKPAVVDDAVRLVQKAVADLDQFFWRVAWCVCVCVCVCVRVCAAETSGGVSRIKEGERVLNEADRSFTLERACCTAVHVKQNHVVWLVVRVKVCDFYRLRSRLQRASQEWRARQGDHRLPLSRSSTATVAQPLARHR
jgi:hypothetical protein